MRTEEEIREMLAKKFAHKEEYGANSLTVDISDEGWIYALHWVLGEEWTR